MYRAIVLKLLFVLFRQLTRNLSLARERPEAEEAVVAEEAEEAAVEEEEAFQNELGRQL